MLKTIIVEDEQLAARRLEKMVVESGQGLEVAAKLESVRETVIWLKENPQPDLIFLDIHLEDGLSFSIFDQVKVDAPVIFTTAYDEYAIKAFKLRSIDYLLKPVSAEDLYKAISKFREWNGKNQSIDLVELKRLLTSAAKSYRERFSVIVGEKLKSIETGDIAYFYSAAGITFMVTKSKNQYSLESSLDTLLSELDPKCFFRINRQYLVSLPSIANIHIFPKSRLKLELIPATPEAVFVSLDKVTEFKKWIDGSVT